MDILYFLYCWFDTGIGHSFLIEVCLTYNIILASGVNRSINQKTYFYSLCTIQSYYPELVIVRAFVDV